MKVECIQISPDYKGILIQGVVVVVVVVVVLWLTLAVHGRG